MQLWWYEEELFSTRVAFWLMDSVLVFESTCSILNTIQNIHQSAPFFSTQEMLRYIQITYQPSCKADTHVSIVDVEHVNLCWRFNSLNACSVPTERERESVNFTHWSEGEIKVQQFNPKALDILMKKVCHQMAPTGIHCMAPIYQHFVDGKGSISDLKTPHFRKGECFVPLTVQYRLIFYGSEERVDLVFITSCSESARSLSYS